MGASKKNRFTYYVIGPPVTLIASIILPIWDWLSELPRPHEFRKEYKDIRTHQRIELMDGGYNDPSEGRGSGGGEGSY